MLKWNSETAKWLLKASKENSGFWQFWSCWAHRKKVCGCFWVFSFQIRAKTKRGGVESTLWNGNCANRPILAVIPYLWHEGKNWGGGGGEGVGPSRLQQCPALWIGAGSVLGGLGKQRGVCASLWGFGCCGPLRFFHFCISQRRHQEWGIRWDGMDGMG